MSGLVARSPGRAVKYYYIYAEESCLGEGGIFTF